MAKKNPPLIPDAKAESRTSAPGAPATAPGATTATGPDTQAVGQAGGDAHQVDQATQGQEAAAASQAQGAGPQQAEQAATAEAEQAAAVALAPKPDPQAKREYVVGTVPILHDGRFYGVGYDIELTDAQAQRLSALVVLVPETPKE